jgi:drug/metabolite transporter (DMT)-like permease
MTSLLCGLAAACCWASTNVLATRVARGPDPRDYAFWFNAFGCAICAPLGLAFLSSASISMEELAWLVVAGLGTAATVRLLAVALARGRLGVVGPLMSLEGAVAAMLALSISGRLSGFAIGGITVSALGSVTVARGARRRGTLAGATYALLGAACAGVALWALGRQSVMPLVALMIVRAVGAASLAPTVRSWRIPSSARWLLPIAALDIAGNVLFMLGARAGSLPDTAVLAAQFGTLTALAGVWHMKEALSRQQAAGLLILAAGVSVIAVAS